MERLFLEVLQSDILFNLKRSRLFALLFIVTVVCEGSSGAHYQYESCVPRNCSNGSNISFPFFITSLQGSYCGYPGFGLNCSQDGFPVLQLPKNNYVVENIFYHNKSLRVYDAAVSGVNTYYENGSFIVNGSYPNENSSCGPTIRNTTLPTPQFSFASHVHSLHFLENCSTGSMPTKIAAYTVACNFLTRPRPLVIFGNNKDFRTALEYCTSNVVAPVETGHDDIKEALRVGFLLKWNDTDSCSSCQNSGGRCGFDAETNNFRCFCPDMPRSNNCYTIAIARKSKTKLHLVEGVAGALTITSVLVTCTLLIIMKNRLNRETQSKKDMELFFKSHDNLAPKRYKYKTLKKITNSFNDKLGKGGYGSVYRGKLEDGRLVAVKILDESKGDGEEFINEVASISRTAHVNIVSLLGFCFDGSKRALVYEFMSNGSLEKFIHTTAFSLGEDRLGWEKLLEIVVGIARGLEYLHRGCNTRILHLDIKPQNILLDEDWRPKIADFGLAKLCPNRASIVSMVEARGTIGYIAPEVFCRDIGDVSYKSDVYSYGMMVLEMAGKRNYVTTGDGTSDIYFPHNIYRDLAIDVETGDSEGKMDVDESECAKRKLKIVGLWCTQRDPKDRPSMSKVVEMLEGKLESLQVPPKPQSSSPTQLAPSFFDSVSMYG